MASTAHLRSDSGHALTGVALATLPDDGEALIRIAHQGLGGCGACRTQRPRARTAAPASSRRLWRPRPVLAPPFARGEGARNEHRHRQKRAHGHRLGRAARGHANVSAYCSLSRFCAVLRRDLDCLGWQRRGSQYRDRWVVSSRPGKPVTRTSTTTIPRDAGKEPGPEDPDVALRVGGKFLCKWNSQKASNLIELSSIRRCRRTTLARSRSTSSTGSPLYSAEERIHCGSTLFLPTAAIAR